MLQKAWDMLRHDELGILGLYGMGGVGKTTILTHINNQFLNHKDLFDIVIWVVVSKDIQIQSIREVIAKRLGLDGNPDASAIREALKMKKFVLLLDDIWGKVDLSEIEVPIPTKENGCKVVFTTRSQEVCRRMRVNVAMEVQCLSPDDALDLFQKKVGEITLNSHRGIPKLAKIVAKKCCGLPLALDVIGETMACKRTVQEWQHAIDVLSSYAAEFSDMEVRILPVLKYSYDNLKDEQLKSCLLYCSLFPEDFRVKKDELIEYWISEGMIDSSEGIVRAEKKGYEIIGNLTRASLLMEDEKFGSDRVYMHDVVREMALWITSDLGKQKDTFVVRAGNGISEMPKVKDWRVVKRMSLMVNKIENLPGNPSCPQLTSLFLQRNKLTNIATEFFHTMQSLVVLDLSYCRNLIKLQGGISSLVSLQYLNMSYTAIYYLPVGLQDLKTLIHLNLEYTDNLSSISGISNLQILKVLRLQGSRASSDTNTVNELIHLKHLEILTIKVAADSSLDKFLHSHMLTNSTRVLEINGLLNASNYNVSEIKIDWTDSPLQNPTNPRFLNLSIFELCYCGHLRDLTFLMFAPNITNIIVSNSNQLVDIISREKAYVLEKSGIIPFQKLEWLDLCALPELRNIYWTPLPFPCLQVITVIECPNLKWLPLDSESCQSAGQNISIRFREIEWITTVGWVDQATIDRFLPSVMQL